MIVWVASFPRSGNNLFLLTLRRVFGAITGSALNSTSLASRLALSHGEDPVTAARERDEAVFVKTHRLPEADDTDPAIYLVRDGRDSLVSYAHYMKARGGEKFGSLSFEQAAAVLIARKDHPFGSWSANVRAWTGRDAPTEIVRFEELIEDPVEVVRNAVRSLGMSLLEPQGEVPRFQDLHDRNPMVFRRGKVGSWRSELPERLERRFWRLHGAEMRALGYPRR